MTGHTTGPSPRGPLSAWRFVVTFGVVSLLADFVYEGARSVTGPLLAQLGASAAVVGAVTGAGEAAALLLRLGSGPLADRTGRFWAWTISGYLLTIVSVPLLGYSSVLWVACLLVISERVGKAVRSPAKDTLLSHATAVTGRGRGFAVHEAMDQVGALIGPLVVAAVLAVTGGRYGPALGVLALPGVAVVAVLGWLAIRVPDPARYETDVPSRVPGAKRRVERASGTRLPRAFWTYAVFTAITMSGFSTFGVLSFHLVERHLLPVAAVPVLYAAAMVVDALAALATGWTYDRRGPSVLLVLPLLAAVVPVLAFASTTVLAAFGALVWGAALGVQESTLRATVADLVGPQRRATAYGIFAAVVGVATAGGGILAGSLYERSIPVLVTVTIAIQLAALVLFLAQRRHLGDLRQHRAEAAP